MLRPLSPIYGPFPAPRRTLRFVQPVSGSVVALAVYGNMIVARHLGYRKERTNGIGSTIRVMLPAATGTALVFAVPLPKTIAALLVVVLTGIAAWQFAAAAGERSHGPTAANDNLFRLILPPDLLRC